MMYPGTQFWGRSYSYSTQLQLQRAYGNFHDATNTITEIPEVRGLTVTFMTRQTPSLKSLKSEGLR